MAAGSRVSVTTTVCVAHDYTCPLSDELTAVSVNNEVVQVKKLDDREVLSC